MVSLTNLSRRFKSLNVECRLSVNFRSELKMSWMTLRAISARPYLWGSDAGLGVDDLAVQVAQLHGVGVRQRVAPQVENDS
jgi:hypothetical protein